MKHYEILMNNGEKLLVDMTDNSPCLIKQFVEAAQKPGDNVMVFNGLIAVKCSQVSVIKKSSK